MELFKTTLDLLTQGLNEYFEVMINFEAAYPVLAFFTLLGLLIAITYLTVKSFPLTKPKEIFNIKERIEHPSWYSKCIILTVEKGILLPVFIVLEFLVKTTLNTIFSLWNTGIKVYFYFVCKNAHRAVNKRKENTIDL